MSKIKKALLTGVSYVLVAALAVGGTLAYLQDTDSDVNVMTLGNVYIEQIEQERDANGNLVDFTQAKPLYPYVGEVAWNDNAININGHDYKMFGEKLKNAQDKIVTVKNTGKSDAYVRTWIALEDPFTTSLLGVNVGGVGYTQSKWTTVTIDGVQYSVACFTYDEALKPGETSLPSFLQVYLKSIATNEDVALLGESYQILAFSQAVQTNGFADAKTALDTAFGAEHPWKNTVFVQSNDEAEILGALTSGKDVILNTDIVEIDDATFNGNGSTVTLAGSGTNDYGYLAFAPGKGNDTKVENLTVTGTGFAEVGHYGMGGGTYEVNKLTIKDMTATLCVNNGGNNIAAAFAHYGTATLTDCVMTGTVAAKEGYTAYDASFVNGTTTTIEGGKYGKIYLANQAKVTINNAEIGQLDSYAISTKNLGKLVIGDGTHIGSLNLRQTGNYPATLTVNAGAEIDVLDLSGMTQKGSVTVDAGATIGKIVANDVEYATIADWQNA